jgi:hypothetical protein
VRATDAEAGNRRESDRVTGGSVPVARKGGRTARYPPGGRSLRGGPCVYILGGDAPLQLYGVLLETRRQQTPFWQEVVVILKRI